MHRYLHEWADEHVGGTAATTAANVLLILHVLSGYVINGNVFNHVMADTILPTRLRQSRLGWFLVTSLTVGGAFVLANILPSLSALLSVLGATCGLALTFIFPPAFALRLYRNTMDTVERYTHIVVLVFAGLALPLCTYATISHLVHILSAANAPVAFGC